jgi:hypothetical protein
MTAGGIAAEIPAAEPTGRGLKSFLTEAPKEKA